MTDVELQRRIEALIHRKRVAAKRDCRVLTEQALAELHRLIMYLGPDAKYLAQSSDADVQAVLKEHP